MENFKITVKNEQESKEAQELFFALGGEWKDSGKLILNYDPDMPFFYLDLGVLCKGSCVKNYQVCERKEVTLPELRNMVHGTQESLISGADALRALADGEVVEFYNKHQNAWHEASGLLAREIIGGYFTDPDDHGKTEAKFRLAPRTIKIGDVDVPAPFEPKIGDVVWFIDDDCELGYSNSNSYDRDIYSHFGWWRTESEIKQVVAALRSILNAKLD